MFPFIFFIILDFASAYFMCYLLQLHSVRLKQLQMQQKLTGIDYNHFRTN
jgi:hypothetical protein